MKKDGMMEIFNRYKMIIFLLIGVVALFVCAKLIGASVKSYANRLENTVEAAGADISVVERERTDKLDTLFGVVKASANHDKIFENIANSRNNANAALDEGNVGGATRELNNAMKNINIIVEAYPELRAHESYKEFMLASSESENKIAQYRTNYNALVKEYNNLIDGSFSSFFLKIAGYKPKTFELLDFGTVYQAPKTYDWEE